MKRQVYIHSEYSNCITAIKYLMHIDSNDGYAKLFYLFASDLLLVLDLCISANTIVSNSDTYMYHIIRQQAPKCMTV